MEDKSIFQFLRAFHQNSLFRNVNLDLDTITDQMDMFLTALSYMLPLIDSDSINSIQGYDIQWEVGSIYDAYDYNNANIEMALDILKMARIFETRTEDYQFEAQDVDVLNRWLYTPRDDGKPRVLILAPDYMVNYPESKIMHFLDNHIKREFAKAKRPCSFFIRLWVRNTVKWDNFSMENGETKEKLVIKKLETHKVRLEPYQLEQKMALVSRYPSNSNTQWIKANEKEAVEWNFNEQNRRIQFYYPLFVCDNP